MVREDGFVVNIPMKKWKKPVFNRTASERL
jgi:hypothetical protein